MQDSVPTSAPPPAAAAEESSLSPAQAIFWASFLGLFLELALIRWVSCEVRVFAYCKNLMLVASFLGFGTGCFLARRKVELLRAMFILLLLALVVRLPWPLLYKYGPQQVSQILADLSGLMIFHYGSGAPWGDLLRLLFAVGWTTVLFFVSAVIMVPFGQITAAGIERLKSPVRAYSINVGGSLLGILTYTFATSIGLPPLCWFVPVSLACLVVKRGPAWEKRGLVGVSLALTLVLIPVDDPPEKRIYWSSYQKLKLFALDEGDGPVWRVEVNNINYQALWEQPPMPPGQPIPVNRFLMPYALRRPPGDVLIVGAGSGNDVAAALQAGATSVTAVEIDRRIYNIGLELHPQAPYSDPRVEVVIDDARHYLRTTDRSFDLIVYSHLDSHTLLSSYTNVRLDDYIHTTEAFREARAHLTSQGILYVSFYAQAPFVGQRLNRNLHQAFGYPPVFLEARREPGYVYFLVGEPEVQARLEAAVPAMVGFPAVEVDSSISPSTDAWPFLPLDERRIPPFVLIVSTVIILLSVLFALRARPRGEAFDGRIFWLGAAFMLVEVHNVSRLALVFGTTWHVNAWVIGAILSVILLANFVFLRLQRAGRRPGRPAVAGLFAALAVAYLVPLDALLSLWPSFGHVAATVLLTLPIFFAGLVFAEAFADSPTPSFALGWNILGAVVGGMAENVSYLWGVPALVPLAAVFYAAAIFAPRFWKRKSEPALCRP